MEYKQVTIHKDDELLSGLSDIQIAELVGCNRTYIFMLRHNKRIAPYKFYRRLKEEIDNYKSRVLTDLL